MFSKLTRWITSGTDTQSRHQLTMLLIMAMAMPLTFSIWRTLMDNFAIEQASFTGAEIGMAQSLREIPGFLTFLFVFITIFIKEQRFTVLSLGLAGFGVALTGFFPTVLGIYATTVLMSIGFHYYETGVQSLQLQWIAKDRAPQTIGKFIAVSSFASLVAYGIIILTRTVFDLDYKYIYLIGGSLTFGVAVFVAFYFPHFEQKVAQRKELVLRKRYWLYYALTFMSGARRQIFVVFAGFMMVERFNFPILAMTCLYLFNHLINLYLAPKIGQLIHKFGERKSLGFEYFGLVLVFSAYGLVASQPVGTEFLFGLPFIGFVAASLFFLDHALFAMALAIKTYFQKIADPADIAPSAGVAFSINHIAAVGLPVVLGLVWIVNNAAVFWIGAGMALVSFGLSRLVPSNPREGNELIWGSATKRETIKASD
jgi:MFS transporter